MHILLVALPTRAQPLGEYLERHGHIVDYASTGSITLHLAAAYAFDAIVVASRLPESSGLQVCRAVRKELRSRTPLLVLLGEASGSDNIAMENGADAYLAAPFSSEDVRTRLASLFYRRRRESHS